jgi:hypothetical protein
MNLCHMPPKRSPFLRSFVILLVIALFAALFAGCFSQEVPPKEAAAEVTTQKTETKPVETEPAPVKIIIDENKIFQTIEDLGGNYCMASYSPKAQDAVGEYLLDTLKPEYVRVPMPLNKWEPVNDNANPRKMNKKAFHDDGVINTLFVMLKDMKEKRGVRNITASVWDIPEWMIGSNTGAGTATIPEKLYDEVIESICAFLLHTKNEYGVDIDYISFNETDLGVNVRFPADEMVVFLKKIGPRLEGYGLKTKFLVGDTHQLGPVVPYVKTVLQNEEARKYCGPISFHSWGGALNLDQEMTAVFEIGKQYNLPVWCGEFGYDAGLWTRPEEYPAWRNAWLMGNLLHRLVKYSGSSVILYWQMMDNYNLASKEQEPYPAYFVWKQMSDNLPAGSQVIGADSQSKDVWALAAKGSSGHFMAQLMNRTDKPIRVSIQGLPDGKLLLLQTYENHNMEEAGSYEPSGQPVIIELPGKSFSTLTTNGAKN